MKDVQTPLNPPSDPSSKKSLSEEIFDTIREPALVLKKDLSILKASASFYAHFNVGPDETIGRKIYELGNFQWDIPELRELLESILSQNSNFNDFEVQHTFKHIGQRTLLLNARRIDHLQLILLAMEDITIRKRIQERLREDEQRIRLLVETASQAVWETDATGHAIKDSRSWRTYTGQIRQELKGRGWLDAIHPDDQERVARDWTDAIMTKNEFNAEYRLRGPEGDWRWTHVQAMPVKNSKGETVKWVGMNLDITDRKQAEQAIQASELFYRQNLDSIPGMLFTTRPDGYCDWQSQQWVDYTGVPLKEHLGGGWNKLLHPDDRQRAYDAWLEAVEKGTPYDLEYRVRRQDGEYQWFKVCGRPIRNEAGEIVRWFGTLLNINQLVQTQEDLQQAKIKAEKATEAKSEFLANMSHEIRTPMTVFLGALEHLRQIDKNPAHKELIDMAYNSGKNLRELIDDILDFSRIEAGRLEIYEEPFDLRARVNEAIGMFSLSSRNKGLKLSWEVTKDVPSIVVGDYFRLKQVLVNLVGNAVKFTHEGEVRVRVQRCGDFLEFSVADTGFGIPEEKHHLLFESFTQVDSSFTRKFGGSGLGLAISKGLVDLMGGEISVRSGEGKGSVFTFTIPLKIAEKQSEATIGATSEDPGKEIFDARILLAEDDPMIQNVITLTLAQRGWQAEIAETGLDAVEKWKRGNFDLILMDLQMPEMNGLEATRTIREKETEGNKHTCIIGLTAHARREIMDDCLKAGMQSVLTKPIQMKKLFSAIDDCLE
jgi:PAS domain S-box-containing protein